MTEEKKLIEEKTEGELSHPAPHHKGLTRRQALFGALLGIGAVAAKSAKAAEESCACLAPPDCDAVCPNGGSPRGDGTQACDCNPAPKPDTVLADIVTPGSAGQNSDTTLIRKFTEEHNTKSNPTGKTYVSTYLAGNTPDNYPAGSFKIPYFTVDSKGRVTSYATRTVTIKNQITQKNTYYYNYYNYYDYYDNNCADSDNGCFVKAKFLTQRGIFDISELRVGDILYGLDGEHRVIGIARNVLGKRKAVSPKGHHNVLLTDDHIILANNKPSVVDLRLYPKNKRILADSENGTQGRYADAWLDNLITENPDAFEVIDLPEDTPTFTPIVDKGHWGRTIDGADVLLCKEIAG